MLISRDVSIGPHCSDPALIQDCINGDERAWNELVARYGRLVYSIALRCGLSASDADDVFQNVWSIVLHQLPSLRDQTRLSSWLITTARRESWRLRRQTVTGLDDAFEDTSILPDEEVLRWEREHQVRGAIRTLDDRCQVLLSALFLDTDEFSYEAIAERLGMPVGSIGPTRARCFKKLEAALIGIGFEPDT
jgi:RNA polymerase sigma factor (sigma-70 family)